MKTFTDGSTYKGDFDRGYEHGYGIRECEAFTYKGNWDRGVENGQGSIDFKVGDIHKYEGEFKEGLPNGQGW